jgi:hypothetical protein
VPACGSIPLGLAAAARIGLLLLGALITHRRGKTAGRRWHRPLLGLGDERAREPA